MSPFYSRASWTAGVVLLILMSAAHSYEVTTTISGFGTIGGSFSSDGNYVYRHDPTEFQGAANQLDIGLESRLGVQATFDFGSGISATAQEVARQRGDKTFDPGTEWLYLQYSPVSDLKLRLGRVELPTFLFSDSRQVGYAAPWFRSPNDVYAAETFNYADGGQALWNFNLGQFRLGLEVTYGTSQVNYQVLGLSINSTANKIFNRGVSLAYGNFLLRVAQTTLDVPSIVPVGPSDTVYFTDHDKLNSAGLQYDDGKVILLAEWAKRQEPFVPALHGPLNQSTQWYVSAGWRVGHFTPLLTYSRYDQEQSLLEQKGQYGTESASLRYDVTHNVALKTQISRVDAGNTDYWITANSGSGAHLKVFSFGADFVF